LIIPSMRWPAGSLNSAGSGQGRRWRGRQRSTTPTRKQPHKTDRKANPRRPTRAAVRASSGGSLAPPVGGGAVSQPAPGCHKKSPWPALFSNARRGRGHGVDAAPRGSQQSGSAADDAFAPTGRRPLLPRKSAVRCSGRRTPALRGRSPLIWQAQFAELCVPPTGPSNGLLSDIAEAAPQQSSPSPACRADNTIAPTVACIRPTD
jgi:hypothetical protein